MSTIAAEALGPTVTIGEILVEIMATTIGDGFLEPLPLIGPFASGAPAIFIDQVAKIGGTAGIIASVGRDDFGRLNLRRLADDGVDISAIHQCDDLPTGTAFVRYRPDGARDFVFNITHSAAGRVVRTPAATEMIGGAGHLHIMGSAFAINGAGAMILEAMESIKERGGSVSFDPNLRKELASGGHMRSQIDRVLGATDLLLPSGEELLVAADETQEAAAIEKLLDRGIGEIVLKRGKEGASLFRRAGERLDVAPLHVEELDPTGAGDCFGAAYLTCRRLGMDARDALHYANAAGARNVTVRGPMEGTASLETLDRFIADHQRA